MEGLDSSSGTTTRDYFNFLLAMSISNILLLHVSHQDLENRKFINDFAFLYNQCFNPHKVNCFSFRPKLPKIILMLRDPRWDNDDFTTFQKYKDLVNQFESEVRRLTEIYANELKNLFEHDKQDERHFDVSEHREQMLRFKIKTFFIVFYQRVGLGSQSKVEFYRMKVGKRIMNGLKVIGDFGMNFFGNSKEVEIKRSRFKCLIKYLNYRRSKNFGKINVNENYFNQLSGIESNKFMKNLLENEKKYKMSREWISSHVYWEINFDVLYQMTNNYEIINFLEKFELIKGAADKIYLKCMEVALEMANMGYNLISTLDKSTIKSRFKSTEEEFIKVVSEKGISNIYELLFKHLIFQNIQRLIRSINLNCNDTQSGLKSCIFSHLFSDDYQLKERKMKYIIMFITASKYYFTNDLVDKALETLFIKYVNYYNYLAYACNLALNQLLVNNERNIYFDNIIAETFKLSKLFPNLIDVLHLFSLFNNNPGKNLKRFITELEAIIVPENTRIRSRNLFAPCRYEIVKAEKHYNLIEKPNWFVSLFTKDGISIEYVPNKGCKVISAKVYRIQDGCFLENEELVIADAKLIYNSKTQLSAKQYSGFAKVIVLVIIKN